jgi:phosphoglycolate phosphatase
MNEKISGIIFDKDGTLFDFASTWVPWARRLMLRLADEDMTRARSLGQIIGFDLDQGRFDRDSIAIAGTPAEVADALQPHLPQYDTRRLQTILNEEAAKAPQMEAVALAPLLQALKERGLRLGVATNDAETPAREHLDAAGVLHLFDFIAGYDSGHGGKPAPGQLVAFAQACDLPANEIVMVGDSTHDLDAGRAAGMRTIGVLTGPAARETLEPLADAILPDIGQLTDWLDRNPVPAG